MKKIKQKIILKSFAGKGIILKVKYLNISITDPGALYHYLRVLFPEIEL
jgi:hypothetical protein